MYPASELRELADRRHKLLLRMQTTRGSCAAGIRRIEGALDTVDGWYRKFHRWSSLAGMVLPLMSGAKGLAGLIRGKNGAKQRRGGVIRQVIRWAPLGWRLYRRIRSLVPAVANDVPDDVKPEHG